jgi:hypothetical protein
MNKFSDISNDDNLSEEEIFTEKELSKENSKEFIEQVNEVSVILDNLKFTDKLKTNDSNPKNWEKYSPKQLKQLLDNEKDKRRDKFARRGLTLIYILLVLFVGLVIFDVVMPLKYDKYNTDDTLILTAIETFKILLTTLIGFLFGDYLGNKNK